MSGLITKDHLKPIDFFKLILLFYRQLFFPGICYGLLAFAPTMIFRAFYEPTHDPMIQIILTLNTIVASILLTNFGYCAICKACRQLYLGEPLDWKVANAVGKKSIFRFSGAFFISLIMIMLWTLCLIIPGFLAILSYAVILPAIVLENKTIMDSLKRSCDLAKGEKWHICKRFIIFGVFFIIFSIIFGAIFLALSSLVNLFVTVEFVAIRFYFSHLVDVILFILPPIFTTLLYFDLRVRKEITLSQNLQVVESEVATETYP